MLKSDRAFAPDIAAARAMFAGAALSDHARLARGE
jgi:hypothetical protein